MNRNDIAKMYEKANGWSPASSENTMNDLERFAALVAAPLEERIQLLYEQLNEAEKQLDAQYKMGVEAEREAILQMSEDNWFKTQDNYEAAIRARGQA